MDEKGVIVEYEDGEIQGYEIGRRFGNAAGLVIPHQIVTPLKVKDKVAVGDVIVYNSGFFEPDFFNPKQVVLKNSINVKTVLWESIQTFEDSSSISRRAAEKLTTSITKVKDIILSFDQAINKLVKVGDKVTADSVLCLIEDSVTANNKLFDDASIDTLKALSAQAPKANINGVVEKIEVYYHGDKEDMSESLKAAANASDKEHRRLANSLGREAFTGRVDGGFRIDGNPLGLDQLAIRIYITTSVSAGLGDKGVFSNQLKTVFGEVFDGDMKTEDGELVDAVFGGKSVHARIVNSAWAIGTTNTLLSVLAKKAVQAYRGK